MSDTDTNAQLSSVSPRRSTRDRKETERGREYRLALQVAEQKRLDRRLVQEHSIMTTVSQELKPTTTVVLGMSSTQGSLEETSIVSKSLVSQPVVASATLEPASSPDSLCSSTFSVPSNKVIEQPPSGVTTSFVSLSPSYSTIYSSQATPLMSNLPPSSSYTHQNISHLNVGSQSLRVSPTIGRTQLTGNVIKSELVPPVSQYSYPASFQCPPQQVVGNQPQFTYTSSPVEYAHSQTQYHPTASLHSTTETNIPSLPASIGTGSQPSLGMLGQVLNQYVPHYMPQFSRASPVQTQGTTNNMLCESNNILKHILLSRLPLPEPEKFDGDFIKFPAWRNTFETLVSQSGLPDNEKLHYLEKCLKGNPLTDVEYYVTLGTGQAYREAIALLESRYGNKYVISSAYRDKLYSWSTIQEDNSLGLRQFSDFCKQVLLAKKTYNNLGILDDETEHLKVLAKLPDALVKKFTRMIKEERDRHLEYSLFERFVTFIVSEANYACDPILSLSAVRSQRAANISVASMSKKSSSKAYVHSTEVKQSIDSCSYCKNKGHVLNSCFNFKKLCYSDRFAFVKGLKLCFSCLQEGHGAKGCRSRLKCSICSKTHPTCMHDDERASKAKLSSSADNKGKSIASDSKKQSSLSEPKLSSANYKSSAAAQSLCIDQNGSDICSMIIPVFLSHSSNPSKEVLVYCLLDSQSDSSFVLDSTMLSLGIEGSPVSLSLSTMMGSDHIVESKSVEGLIVRGYDRHSNKNSIKLPKVYTRSMMPANRSHIPTKSKVRSLPKLAWLHNILSDELEVPIALLIGYNCAQALRPLSVITSSVNGPYAQQSLLGWGVVGFVKPVEQEHDNIGKSHSALVYTVKGDKTEHKSAICFRSSVKEVFTPLDCAKLLEQDFTVLDDKETLSIEDKRFLSILQSNVRQQGDGHYILPLPFKDQDRPILPCNKRVALQRLGKLRERFKHDNQYYLDYCRVMDNLLQQGHASKRDGVCIPGRCWFLPHHGVYHPKKKDKLRVVFDGSSKCQGISLNQCLLSGPDLMNSLVGILCRFRKERVGICCDIQEMFHQFVVEEPYRDYLSFYWYPDNDYTQEPCVYVMNRHLFGSTSSPGCSNFCLKQLAIDHRDNTNQQACEFLNESFYVDDGVISVSSSEEAISIINQTVSLCKKGALKLHKFISNCPKVREAVGSDDSRRSSFIERTLGVTWCLESDSLQFRITIDSKPYTRRGILSIVSSVYDPLGLVGPYVLEGKKLLQEVCASGAKWDDNIPDILLERWRKWLTLIVNLNSVVIPRCYKSPVLGIIRDIQLHHFSDASMKAYGQCSYIRYVDEEDRVHCSLIMGKSRVSPIKTVTVPRLELMAALLSVKVSLFLEKELHFDNVKHYFWCDSKIVLAYISNESKRYHTFVANRVQQIRDGSDISSWHYVPTSDNPADDASRGLDLSSVTHDCRWFRGPDFLWQSSVNSFDIDDFVLSSDDPEIRSSVFCTSLVGCSDILVTLSRYSSWSKIIGILVQCFRFIHRLQGKTLSRVSVSDHRSAELCLIKLIQSQHFHTELVALRSKSAVPSSSRLSKLSPFIDGDGFLRLGGRLSKCKDYTYDVKHPYVLPSSKSCIYSNLIIQYFHCKVFHQGRGVTVAKVRNSGYWILGIVNSVSSFIYNCIVCNKLYRQPDKQLMSPLPSDRVREAAPFTYCSVDVFGPYYVREGRKSLKRYGVIFVCLACKGIHIEVVNSLSTDSFINAYRRLVAIRGQVRTMRSDCGTNFTGASRELSEELQSLNHSKIYQFLQSDSCDYDYPQFKFNKPYASHTGGIWERQIRSARRVINGIISSLVHQLDDESLRTFLSEAAGIVNSRPLYVDTLADPNSVQPISPNSLLTMKSSVILPPPMSLEGEESYSKRRWKLVQSLCQQFWNRWRKEYLHNLQLRSKWNKPKRNYAVGDIVLLTDDSLPRCEWHLSRVIEVYPGSDGIVRSVKLLVGSKDLNAKGKPTSATSTLCRSVHKIVYICSTDK